MSFMQNLNTLVARGDGDPPWSHLVVIGAGDGQRTAVWSAVSALRRDFVEADPQRAAALQRSHGSLPSTQVWPHVVAISSGPVTWCRYQPDFLDGVFDAGDLRDVYPRLQCIDRQDVDGLALGDLLVRLGVRGDAPADRLLILDVPGARRLLASGAAHPVLRGCERIVVRDVLDPLDGASEDVDVPLGSVGFVAEPVADGWRSFRRDLDRIARIDLRQALQNSEARCTALELQIDQGDLELRELRATRERLAGEVGLALERAQAAERAAEEARRSLTDRVAEAGRRSVEQQAEAQRLAAALQAKTVEQEGLGARVRELEAQLAERDAVVGRCRVELERAASEAATRELELRLECESASARAAAAEAAHHAAQEEQRALQTRCAVATERAQHLERKLAEVETAVQGLQRDKQTLTAERDSAQKVLQEKTRRVQALEAEVADVRARLDVTIQEIGRAEGQLEMLKDLFVQESAL